MRPEILPFDNNDLITEIYTHRKMYYEDGEFADVFVFPSLIISKEERDKLPELPIDENMFTDQRGQEFNQYTYGVGKINRLAEIHNDHLQSFIGDYFQKNKVEDFYKRNAKCEALRYLDIEKNITRLTFGNLMNIMRLISKTDEAFHQIEQLNDDVKRRRFRQTYDGYVLDRDRFTHGKLFFKYPEFVPVLRVKKPDGSSYYINYSKEIFAGNLETFIYLENVMAKMREVMNQ